MTDQPKSCEVARPLEEWHEDMGDQLWWFDGMGEPPYVGSPLDCGQTVEVSVRYYHEGKVVEKLHRHFVGGWPGIHTHFTPIPAMPVLLMGKNEQATMGENERATD